MEFNAKYLIIIVLLLIIGAAAALLTKHFFAKENGAFGGVGSGGNFKMPTDGVKKVTLDNGMTLVMYKTDTQPKVLIQIAYDVGSYIEQEGERGLAHLLEHMIFKGTQKLSESDLDEIARKYGATYNAFTSTDMTSYYFEVDKNNWQPFVDILADCMQNARFDQQHLNSELKAVLQELRMNRDSYWHEIYYKALTAAFPANHPYHYTTIGYKEDLMNVSSERVKSFYKKYYQPNRASLFVIGDINFDEVTKVVTEKFHGLANAHEPISRDFIHLPPSLKSSSQRLFEDVQSDHLGLFWRIPGLKSGNEVLTIATAALLGEGEGSRFTRALVDEHKVATNVSVGDYSFMEAGLFAVLVEPLPGKTEECRSIIAKELAKAVADGFTDAELALMAKAKVKESIARLQKFSSMAYEWIQSYFAHRDEYLFFNQPEKFAHVTSAQVQEFIKSYLDPLVVNQVEVVPMPPSLAQVSKEAKAYEDELDKKILTKYVRTAPIEEPQYALHMPPPHKLEYSYPKPDLEFTLSNGLRVLLHKQSALPILSVGCKFKEFSYLSRSREGLNVSLMMDMLIEGSEGFTKKDNVDFFEQYAADYSFGATGAGLSLLNADLAPIFERFVHVLTRPIFAAQDIEKIREQHADAYKRALDDNTEVAKNLLQTLVYANHPFGWTYQEALVQLAKLDLTEIKKLHRELIAPSNMVLTIVGDMDLKAMEHLVKKAFSGWQAGTQYSAQIPGRDFRARQELDYPMLRDQVVLIMGQPSPITVQHQDYVPLKLLNYITFYSLGSRIYKLREQTGLFYHAFGAWAAGAELEAGYDFVGAIVNPDKAVEAEQGIRKLIDELAKNGITEDELGAARQMYLKTLIDQGSSNGSVASTLGTIAAWNLGFDHYDRVLDRVQSITLEEMNQVCARYCSTANMARVRAGRIEK